MATRSTTQGKDTVINRSTVIKKEESCITTKQEHFNHQNSSVCDKNNNEIPVDVICWICQTQFKNPKLLPCLHTFCKRCLEISVQDAEKAVVIRCPLCSWDKKINSQKALENYFKELPSNFLAVNTLDTLAINAVDDEEAMLCVACSKGAQTVSRCSECALFLCMNCERAHRKNLKSHNISSFALLNLRANQSMRKVTYCKIHTGEALSYYCNTCNCAICNDCTFLDHPKSVHSVTTLSDITRRHRRQLAELVTNVRGKLPFLKRTVLDIDSVLESLPDHADAVAREIARTTEDLIFALQQRQERLLDELTQLCLRKVQILQDQKNRVEAEVELLEANCRTTENILIMGSDSEIASINSLLYKRLQYLCETPLDIEAEESSEFGYDRNDSVLTDLINNNGKVYLTNISTPLKALGDGLHGAAVGKLAMFIMAKSNHSELSSPGGVEVRIETPDSVLLACDVKQSHNLFHVFYNPKVPGEHEISITVKGEHVPDSPFCINVKNGHMTFTKTRTQYTILGTRGNKPGYFDQVSDVAVRNNGSILTVDSCNHRIQEFDYKGNFVSEFGNKGEDWGRLLYPSGIAISPDGHVIVTEHGNHRVQVFTSDGLYLWSFGNQGDAEGLMDHPTGIAVDEEGQLVIVDQHNHRIQIFDKHGHFNQQFGCYGDQNGQFDRPLHVAINYDGKIFATDSGNHRVQIFSEFGCFLRTFGRQGTGNGEFWYPSGITIDACGFVFVSDKGNRVQVFNPELEFVATLDPRDRGRSSLDGPMGLDYSPEGKIVVADKNNHQVKILYN